jgi:hypothetical protein
MALLRGRSVADYVRRMEVVGDYQKDGYAHLKGLISPRLAHAVLKIIRENVMPGPIPLHIIKEYSTILKRPALEIDGYQLKPLLFFLWGMTPTISGLVGREVVPTYDYFRVYQAGDICRVHSDRYACEHSLSLTLAYSDGRPWDLEVGRDRVEAGPQIDETFGDAEYGSVTMEVGDAVLYQGVHHRHGRMTPNPNGWSAHLFMHWVDQDGPYREQAFDGLIDDVPAQFTFA